jgi:phosphonopyruvate decarboxylase
MIDAKVLLAALSARNYTAFCGVPCSYFADVYRAIEVMPDARIIANSNEGSAYATAAGFAVAGERCAVFLQNSGLGNLVNPLTSLVMPYGIPLLAFVSLRGWPTASAEEPQHSVMGRSTAALLDAIHVANFFLPASDSPDETTAALEGVLDAADRVLAQRRPAFVLVPRGVLSAANVLSAAKRSPASAPDLPLDRRTVLSALARGLPGALFVTTTGYTSRDMFAVVDQPENLYLQGAMGHAASVALGVALAQPDRRVVAVDGDGSAIMHMGTMSTVGACLPANLLHVVLDNGSYESTGGQPTTALNTAFADIARACGYRAAVTVDDLGQLTRFLSTQFGGPALVHARIGMPPGVLSPRATAAVGPMEIASRFSVAIGVSNGRSLVPGS